MSMLAGPRWKQQIYNLRAKNSAWSNDSNKFGQRMLEKMGWSSGKGLGANEDGIKEHVVAKYKNDEKGLGFEVKNDQWMKHEDDFNTLLANLSNADTKEEKLHSGVSLEDKSKKSRSRIHYHKFVRGKDLSHYTEKELANIFGKKSLKQDHKLVKTINDEDKKATEQVFTHKGSMDDYFKDKLAAFKSKNKATRVVNIENEDAEYTFKGFSQTNNDTESEENHQGFGSQSFSLDGMQLTSDVNNENETPVPVKKHKKNKKSKRKNKASVESYQEIDSEDTPTDQSLNQNCIELTVVDLGEIPIFKENKTKKLKLTKSEIDAEEDISEKRASIKKKLKNKNFREETIVQEQTEKIQEPKKKKKIKEVDSFNIEKEQSSDAACIELTVIDLSDIQGISINKTKEKKYPKPKSSPEIKDTTETYVPIKKKSKKK